MAILGDWRGLNCASPGLDLDPDCVYYWHSRAHGLKGILGGTHGHISFYDGRWYTVEITDEETLEYQDCEIVHRTTDQYQVRAAFISTRRPDQYWFGNKTTAVSECYSRLKIADVIEACDQYPYKSFDMIFRNCNTFVSFLIFYLNLNLERPLVSVGYRSQNFWMQNYKLPTYTTT